MQHIENIRIRRNIHQSTIIKGHGFRQYLIRRSKIFFMVMVQRSSKGIAECVRSAIVSRFQYKIGAAIETSHRHVFAIVERW